MTGVLAGVQVPPVEAAVLVEHAAASAPTRASAATVRRVDRRCIRTPFARPDRARNGDRHVWIGLRVVRSTDGFCRFGLRWSGRPKEAAVSEWPGQPRPKYRRAVRACQRIERCDPATERRLAPDLRPRCLPTARGRDP